MKNKIAVGLVLFFVLLSVVYWLPEPRTRFSSDANNGQEPAEKYDPSTAAAHTFRNSEEELEWQKYFDKFAPKKGDAAPDFELSDVDGKNPVRLSDFRGKQPVALIFGSLS